MTLKVIELTDEDRALLEKELAEFTAVAQRLSPGFVTPSLREFALAKITGHSEYLLESSIRKFLGSNSYADPHRVMQQEFAQFLRNFVLAAKQHGFVLAHRDGATLDERSAAISDWIDHLSQIEPLDADFKRFLAMAIEGATVSVDDAACFLFNRKWHAIDRLPAKVTLAHKSVLTLHGLEAHRKLAELITLGGLAVEIGVMDGVSLDATLSQLKLSRPDLFRAPSPSLGERIARQFHLMRKWWSAPTAGSVEKQ